MSEVKFNYIVLKLLLFAVFLIFGWILSKTKLNKTYCFIAFILILTFGIVEGLRFGRMIDYNLYYFRYIDIGQGVIEEQYEPLFLLICYTLYNCGVPYYIFIFLQCSFLMFSTIMLMKNYREIVAYALPFIPFLFLMNENFIRWYLAFSFILLSVNALIQDKKNVSWVWAICGVLVHFGFFFYFFFLLCHKFFNRVTIKPIYSICLVFAATFLFSITNMRILIIISDFLLSIGIGNLSNDLNFYLNNMAQIIQGDMGTLGILEERSFSNNVRTLLACIPVIYYGHRYVKLYKSGVYIYNLFVIGAICNPIFTSVELLGRISGSLLFFICIIAGIVFTRLLTKQTLRHHFFVFMICSLSFFASCWPSISIAFGYTYDMEMLFIWDAGSRKYLPY